MSDEQARSVMAMTITVQQRYEWYARAARDERGWGVVPNSPAKL